MHKAKVKDYLIQGGFYLVLLIIFLQIRAVGAIAEIPVADTAYGVPPPTLISEPSQTPSILDTVDNEATVGNNSYPETPVSDEVYAPQPPTIDEVVYPVYEAVYDNKVAVTTKYWDNMGWVLTAMSEKYTNISDADLADYQIIKNYNIIFINNSAKAARNAAYTTDSIKTFVNNGGILFVSDYAVDYINSSFPGYLQFAEQARIGKNGKITAGIVDTGLKSIYGSTDGTLKLNYRLQSWAVLESTSSRVKTLIKGSYNVFNQSSKKNNMPLAVSFTYGKGTVIYTTFTLADQSQEMTKSLLKSLVFDKLGGK